MLRKIAHVIVDDKFIDMAFREFEAVAPGQNQLVMLGDYRPLHYVRSAEVGFYSTKQARRFIRSDECAAIVFHSLYVGFLPLLQDIPANKKVFWLGWGYDYYDRLLSGAYPEGLFLPRTRSLLPDARKRGAIRAVASACKTGIKRALARSTQDELLSRVDYFSPVIDSDYEMAIQLNPWFRPRYVTWNYGTMEDDLSSDELASKLLGDNILVGNSAAPENNHIEVFELLERNVELTDRQIIVPLSYGDESYKEKIIIYGQAILGNRFVPVPDFLDKESYFELLQSCGYVFMNHLRQQALGNICIMMLKGAKIYMNSQSPLYRWLIAKGGLIQSIDSLAKRAEGAKHILRPHCEEHRFANAEVIKGHWGQEIQRAKTRRLVDIAMGIT